jgi:cysteine sulfinate desulfinase/cysteine desulfurase-like protein
MEVNVMTKSTNLQVEVSSGSACNDKITNLQVEVSSGSACNDKIH